MVKLTYLRSTSLGQGTHWDLSSGCTIRIPHWVPLYHGPIRWHLLSLRSILYEVTFIFLNFLIYTRMKKIGNIFSDAKKTVKPVAWNTKIKQNEKFNTEMGEPLYSLWDGKFANDTKYVFYPSTVMNSFRTYSNRTSKKKYVH